MSIRFLRLFEKKSLFRFLYFIVNMKQQATTELPAKRSEYSKYFFYGLPTPRGDLHFSNLKKMQSRIPVTEEAHKLVLCCKIGNSKIKNRPQKHHTNAIIKGEDLLMASSSHIDSSTGTYGLIYYVPYIQAQGGS
jgi:hypothetical protein